MMEWNGCYNDTEEGGINGNNNVTDLHLPENGGYITDE